MSTEALVIIGFAIILMIIAKFLLESFAKTVIVVMIIVTLSVFGYLGGERDLNKRFGTSDIFMRNVDESQLKNITD